MFINEAIETVADAGLPRELSRFDTEKMRESQRLLFASYRAETDGAEKLKLRNKIISSASTFIYFVIKNNFFGSYKNFSQEDLFQEAVAVCLDGLDKWNPERSSLLRYFEMLILSKITYYVRRNDTVFSSIPNLASRLYRKGEGGECAHHVAVSRNSGNFTPETERGVVGKKSNDIAAAQARILVDFLRENQKYIKISEKQKRVINMYFNSPIFDGHGHEGSLTPKKLASAKNSLRKSLPKVRDFVSKNFNKESLDI